MAMEVLSVLIVSFVLIALLGVVVAFSPTLVVTELAVLTRSKQPVLHTVAFIAGIAVAVTIFCLAATLFVDPAKDIDIPNTREVLGRVPLMDIIIGVLLLAAGRHFLKTPSPTVEVEAKKFKPERLLSARTLFWFGFLKMATSLSSIAAILVASRFIKTTLDQGSLQFAAIVWLITISILPFVILVTLQQYRPEIFQRIQAASDRATGLNWRRIIAWTLIVAGAYFLVGGVINRDQSRIHADDKPTSQIIATRLG